MKELNYDIVIIGGGIAGIASALSAYDLGCRSIVVLEKENKLGGILNQCIHSGFGIHTFNEELTGREYASYYINELYKRNIEYKVNTIVENISKDKIITTVSYNELIVKYKAKAIILANGCYEKTIASMKILGNRPSNIYTAGTVQKMVNCEGVLPGKEVIILGSGDIGLIMARRLTLEGVKVKCIVEILPKISGLDRNKVQCLDDYNIPVLLSHTVTDVIGQDKIEALILCEVDKNKNVLYDTKKTTPCDCLITSCGLLPDNTIALESSLGISNENKSPKHNQYFETTREGIFICGNAAFVHALVDDVEAEAKIVGNNAYKYVCFDNNFMKVEKEICDEKNFFLQNEILLSSVENNKDIIIDANNNDIHNKKENIIKKINCPCCPVGCTLQIEYDNDTECKIDNNVIESQPEKDYKVNKENNMLKRNSLLVHGNKCEKGKRFALEEHFTEQRVITTILNNKFDGDIISVKTSKSIPKEKIFECMREIKKINIKSNIYMGKVLLKNIANTGADIVVTSH